MHTSTESRGQLNTLTISLRLCHSSCKAVFGIRDVYPGSEFFPSRIPHPNFFHPGSRIRIKEFMYFNPKNCFQALGNMIRVVHPGSGSRIQWSKRHRILDADPQHCCTVVQSVSVPVWRRGWQRRVGACVPGSIPILCARTRHGFPHPQLYSKKNLITTWNSRKNIKKAVLRSRIRIRDQSKPYVIGPPGSGSGFSSQRYGSGAGAGSDPDPSIIKQK